MHFIVIGEASAQEESELMQFSYAFLLVLLVLGSGCAAPEAQRVEEADTARSSDFTRVLNWRKTPTPNENLSCQPQSTDIPAGEMQMLCRVENDGRLSECTIDRQSDPRLGEWGRCLSQYFVAEEEYKRQDVIFPLQWVTPPN